MCCTKVDFIFNRSMYSGDCNGVWWVPKPIATKPEADAHTNGELKL